MCLIGDHLFDCGPAGELLFGQGRRSAGFVAVADGAQPSPRLAGQVDSLVHDKARDSLLLVSAANSEL